MKEEAPLIAGEQVLMTLEKSPLVLTNYRVRFDMRDMGASSYQSISLEAIAYCGFVSNSQPIVLLFGLVFLCVGTAGVFVPNPIKQSVLIGTVLLLLALAFLIIYFATRSAILEISATSGDKITLVANHVKRVQIIAFLEAVLEAKLRFNRKILPAEKSSGS
ncbi:MAG: hypothetical protein PHI11_03015 [Gallionella sp.]|nr:hypothetical protein [Gallionella sp.]